MTLATIPLEDNYNTTLAQERDGAVGTVYVNTAPTFTFPATRKSYITVDPGTDKMQVARISAYNATTKTLTVDSTAVYKGAGVLYTEQSHSIGAKVIISDNYQFWADLANSLDLKVDTNDDDVAMGKFADETARDAYFTSPVNGNSAYVTSLGLWTDYIGGAWVDRATGSVANGSETVAGKFEEATDAETTAGTATGGTGAKLAVTPTKLAKVIQSGSYLYAGASATGNDTYVVSMTPALTAYTTSMRISFLTDVANTGACTINIDSLGAKSIKLIGGSDPSDGDIPATTIITLEYDGTNFVYNKPTVFATDAEAAAKASTTLAISPSHLKYAGSNPTAGTSVRVAFIATEKWQNGTTYVQKYIGTVLNTGDYTVSFGLGWQNGGSGGAAYGRIYKNGVAFGTEQSTTTAYPSFTTKTENLAFTAGDTISLWLKAGVPASDIAYANNFLLTCDQLQFTLT